MADLDEMRRSRLHATDGTGQQDRSGTEMNAPMTVGRITPRPAFRLLTLILLIFALADLLPPEILHGPKRGFSAPVGSWLRGPLR